MSSLPNAPGTFVAPAHLVDPHGAMRAIRHARRCLPLMLELEKMVMRNEPEPEPMAAA
jgi:hypothetical protein